MSDIKIKIGQHWQEVGEGRMVCVVSLPLHPEETWVRIRTIPRGREGKAERKRFHGKRGGYKLVKDVEND